MKRISITSNRELGELILLAQSQGWVITKRTNNHLKWVAPSGFVYFSSVTPSDGRAIKNIKSDLRRAGLILAPLDNPR